MSATSPRRIPHRAARAFALGLTALAAGAPAALAQEQVAPPRPDTTFTVQGEVLDAASGTPLAGVLVAIHDLWAVTRTDELGYFEFRNVPAGLHEFGVYGLGYLTVEETVEFVPGEILEVKLSPAPMEIEGLTVDLLSAEELEYRSTGVRYDFIGPDLMPRYRQRYRRITDILRARFPSVRVVDWGIPGASGFCVRNTRASTTMQESSFGCALMLIDGLEADGEDVVALDPDHIESIRYIPRIEARLLYGDLGRYGALLITTVDGRERRRR